MRAPDGRRIHVVFLIATGFDEEEAIGGLTQWREAGLSAALVSLTGGTVVGAHGLAVRADATLERLLTASPARMIFLPGGETCAAALLADPRVHQLVASVQVTAGRVVVLRGAQGALAERAPSGWMIPGALLQQNGSNLREFVSGLILQALDEAD